MPDNRPAGFDALFDSIKKKWTNSPMRLVLLNPAEFYLTRRMNNPHLNCWLQFIRGCNAASSAHLLWHDADLFITDKEFLKKHYETCLRQHCAVLGLNEAWDPWYRDHGYPHLTSTWEILVELDWVRSFSPWQHRGHDGAVNGKTHTFDITFLPQCLTPAEKVRRHEGDWGFVHFNYVIGTYRRFQNSQGAFEDDGFKLLLVRLLIDAYDKSSWSYEVPEFDRLLRGIQDASCRVTYLKEETKKNYPDFRLKFQKLIDSGVAGAQREAVLRERIGRFDRAFGWKA